MKNNTLKYRVGKLEDWVKSLDHKIDKLLINDIPHINTALTKMDTTIKVMTVINVGAIITGILIAKYL